MKSIFKIFVMLTIYSFMLMSCSDNETPISEENKAENSERKVSFSTTNYSQKSSEVLNEIDVNFKFIVSIQASNFYNFIGGKDNNPESSCDMKPWIKPWEKWELINYNSLDSNEVLRFGDIIGFKNLNFNTYLSGHPGAQQVTTQPNLQDAERWRLINPYEANSNKIVSIADEFYLQQVNSGKFCVVSSYGILNSIPFTSDLGSATKFRIILTE